MKYAYATTLLLLAATCGLQAAKDDKLAAIPKEKEGRWGIFTFADAKEEAAKKKRPIAIIVQDDKTEENTEKQAVLRAYWGVEKDAVVVLTTGRLIGEQKRFLTPETHAALTSAEVGKTLPRMAVMSSDATIPLGVMNQEQMIGADEKAFKEFGKKMEDANKNPAASKLTLTTPGAKPAAPATPAATTTPATAAPAGPVTIKDPKAESWTNAEGRAVQMTLVSVNGTEATFQLAGGKTIPLDVSKLSEASKKRVEELVAASK